MKDLIQLGMMMMIGIMAYILIPNQKLIKFAIVLAMAVVFIAWGIRQHLVNKTLSPKILLEYLFLSCLGIALLFFLLYYD